MDVVNRVLEFWFGSGESGPRRIWFEKDPEFDRRIAQQFGADHAIATSGGYDDRAQTADGALALVILLDQFSRNLYRDQAAAFAADPKALEIARTAIAAGFDLNVAPLRRVFFYLPFEHSENLADQQRGITLFEALGDAHSLEYMIKHRDIIARFGRFPHRNAALGRESTDEEKTFLAAFPGF